MKELVAWSIFKNSYSDAKTEVVLHLRLVDVHSHKKTTTNIVFDEEGIPVIDMIINKQLIPSLRGGEIERGDYAVEKIELRKEKQISEMAHYG